MKSPLVSTLICTYNAEEFIENTLLSVVNQSYKNQEILVLDNGSKDSSIKIIKEMQKKYPNITLFNEGKNLGAYVGLNYLLDKAKGEYIAIQDHDDIWHTDKLKLQIDYLEKNKKSIGSGTGTLMYYGKSKVGFCYDTTQERQDSKVIHTSLVFRNQGQRYDTSNDFLCDGYFMQNILSQGKKALHIIPIPLTLHYYKETGGNYSEQRFKLKRKNIVRYFNVYGYNWYFTFLLIYLIFCKLLPQKRKVKFDFALLCRIKKAKTKIELEKNTYLKNMLQYY